MKASTHRTVLEESSFTVEHTETLVTSLSHSIKMILMVGHNWIKMTQKALGRVEHKSVLQLSQMTNGTSVTPH
jgi:hypothetical protein